MNAQVVSLESLATGVIEGTITETQITEMYGDETSERIKAIVHARAYEQHYA